MTRRTPRMLPLVDVMLCDLCVFPLCTLCEMPGFRRYITPNVYTVRVLYSSPGRSTVDGNDGLFGESG